MSDADIKKRSTMSVHFSSKTDNWATPQDFFDAVNDEFSLLWDVCASHENAKLPFYWTRDQDGLSADWRGKRVWMNPPYGSEIGKWVEKAATGGAAIAVCLLPARTDTRWFHRHIYGNPKAEMRFVKGRLKFGGAITSAPFPSMLVIFRQRRGSK
jgi:phage N-6-adenine-methyltransferase